MFCYALLVSSTLIPKANAWLQENLDIYLVKCETLEKKVTAVDEVTADNCMFLPKNHHAIYVKGLRYIFKHLTIGKWIEIYVYSY